MAEHKIVVLAGDHCGPEVVAEGIRVLKAIEENKPSVGKFILQEHLMGGCSIDAHGTPLTDETLEAAKAADAVLLGSIGGPEWGTGAVRPEQGLLRIRKEMGTYGNLRPCFFASEALVDASPLKAEVCRGTDFVIVRELTGGIYFGDRKEDDGSGHAYDIEPYSRAEVERIARLAGFLARGRGETKVWSLDKANVLATSRLWRKVMTETFEKEFPDLKIEHQLIDSAAMIMVKNPRGLNGVVVTSNLFGDIISDEASVIPGSIGLLPSASLSGIPDGNGKCNGIYEPIHGMSSYYPRLQSSYTHADSSDNSGSAPDISGKGIVNPIGTILSVAMLLRYSLSLAAEAKAVEDAVRAALDGGVRSKDLGGSASTKEVGDAVVKELVQILKA
ncbi:Isopropylmalate dehydrogenase-like domain-containing protein [Thelonectria olida]|uniref:3-isopropylmalate dehydrogenase n=1 Tax=Thelonectria olida TaxID=1576542 RepID=A0A9P9ARX2_9HYPO|nr:Isopropylmalate dehydrogenase-like domain-containing protein [Thelonectria olida]